MSILSETKGLMRCLLFPAEQCCDLFCWLASLLFKCLKSAASRMGELARQPKKR